MRTARRGDNLADRLLAEGRAAGQAEGRAAGQMEGRTEEAAAMLLRILRTRGFAVPGEVRERIMSCTDTAQLEEWAVLAVTAQGISEIFGG
jgi:flagellar biosynthesis/type III secretory pathway protein FliH